MRTNNPLLELRGLGQSVWLDDLARPMIDDGRLARWISEGGIPGITSNPSTFNHALKDSSAYESDIRTLAEQRIPALEIYEALALSDVQDAADLLRPTYDETDGRDGYVSFEVSPKIAHDTRATI